MADEFDFSPDFSEDTEENKVTVYPSSATVVTNDSNQSVTISKLLDMTKQHIEDDNRVRGEIDELTGIIDSTMSQMTIKEMIEYLKVKLKEREMHIRCIYDAYKFIQQTEMAREMLIGSDRKERVLQAIDNTKYTKVMGFLNANFDRG
nr:MAG TPA: hypothetical protein [Caudoviricetes sp.]